MGIRQASRDGSREAIEYRRRFRVPFRTAFGLWEERVGWILRARMGDGLWTYSEMCSVPGFPGVSHLNLSEQVDTWMETGEMDETGGAPAFARWSFKADQTAQVSVSSAGLVSADGRDISQRPVGTFKIKIAGGDLASELRRLDELIYGLSEGCRFRLDGNQSLSLSETEKLLDWMVSFPQVEFVEQPMKVGSENVWFQEFGNAARRIALDESVSKPNDLYRFLGAEWPGYFIVKPMLFGDVEPLIVGDDHLKKRLIFSSVFETGVGFGKLLDLVRQSGMQETVHGFGTRGYLEDESLDGWSPSLRFEGKVDQDYYDRIWENAVARTA